jgi:hypothetical protein
VTSSEVHVTQKIFRKLKACSLILQRGQAISKSRQRWGDGLFTIWRWSDGQPPCPQNLPTERQASPPSRRQPVVSHQSFVISKVRASFARNYVLTLAHLVPIDALDLC